MAASSLLLDDDDDDINDVNLQDFYVSNLSCLKKIPMYSIPSPVLSKIGMIYHSTLLSESDWRYFAYDMGLEDNVSYYKIERHAKNLNETSLYIALNSILQHDKTFGDMIEIFLQRRRLDILSKIKAFVEVLLKRKSTELKTVVSVDEKLSENGNETSETIYDINSLKTESEISGDIDTLEIKEESKCEFLDLCKNSVIIEEEMLSNKPPSMAISITQPISPENSLIVLIQYTECDWSIAQKLSSALREARMTVKLLSDIEHILMIDTLGALRAIFQEVDYIVPIVSETFVKQVLPCINEQCPETSDARDNRCLYKLYANEFIRNQCINIRVKPVIVPKMDRYIIQDDLILCKSLRLWEEVPKLVSVLKKTKELIPNYPFL